MCVDKTNLLFEDHHRMQLVKHKQKQIREAQDSYLKYDFIFLFRKKIIMLLCLLFVCCMFVCLFFII